MFTPEEVQHLKNGLAPMANQITGLKSQIEDHQHAIKSHKTTISHLENKISTDSKLIEDGFEFRPVACVRFKSYKMKCWIFVSKQTCLEVARESFGINDDQVAIDDLIWPEDRKPARALHDVMLEIALEDVQIPADAELEVASSTPLDGIGDDEDAVRKPKGKLRHEVTMEVTYMDGTKEQTILVNEEIDEEE